MLARLRVRDVSRSYFTGRVINCRGLTTTPDSPVLLEFADSKSHPYARFGILSLNRSKTRNALSIALIETLGSHVSRLRSESNLRGVILKSSTQGTFCAGADLVERRDMSPRRVAGFLSDMRSTFTGLSQLKVPTISVIEGHALGGGLELALCTDFRVVGAQAQLGLPETRLGIIPGAGGTQRLTRLVGVTEAKDMIFGARILSGQEAVRLGIATELSETPYETALAYMESYVHNSPIGIAQSKQAIDFAHGNEMEDGLDYEREMYDVCLQGPDRDEGLLAFKEKRRPVYGVPSGSAVESKILLQR